jgi:hypothetical protein
MRLVLIGGLLTLLAASCGGPARIGGPSAISFATSDGVRFRNPTARTVYYTAMERETATLVDWVPCADPARCPSVPPRGETVIPYASISGYEPGDREAIVYYWELVPATPEGGFQVQNLRSEVVLLVTPRW